MQPTNRPDQPVNQLRSYWYTGSALSVIRPSLSLVRQSWTRYWTVFVTRRSPANSFRQSLKTNLFRR